MTKTKKSQKKKKRDRKGIFYLLAFLILLFIISSPCLISRYPIKSKVEFQKGICYVTWSRDRYATKESDESMKKLAKTGAKWVALVTTWYQDGCSATKIYPNKNTPGDESLIHAINTAHSLGLKVMLKPHLDLIDTSGGSWRGDISCATEPDWEAWFNSYKEFITYYAKMAQQQKVELFCIGTELTTIATMREKMWKEKIIQPVREIYKGPLTYAANWDYEYMHVKFWDALDYVGIDAYFPVADKDRPTLDEIKDGWKKWVEEMESFQKMVNKPIIFPEVGYCSAKGTAKTPWEEVANGSLDVELQADCFQALFETFWNKDWFYGVYWWRWGTDVRFGGLTNRGFSFQNKPAEDIVKKWYKKMVPPKKKF